MEHGFFCFLDRLLCYVRCAGFDEEAGGGVYKGYWERMSRGNIMLLK